MAVQWVVLFDVVPFDADHLLLGGAHELLQHRRHVVTVLEDAVVQGFQAVSVDSGEEFLDALLVP